MCDPSEAPRFATSGQPYLALDDHSTDSRRRTAYSAGAPKREVRPTGPFRDSHFTQDAARGHIPGTRWGGAKRLY